MKATGIVRRIDDLGRVVIPKEIRRTLRIREGDPLEIYTDREGQIVLKKYSMMGDLGEFAKQYAEALSQTTCHIVAIADRDIVIAASGGAKKDLLQKPVSKELEQVIDDRQSLIASGGEKNYKTIANEEEHFSFEAISPIICEGDAIGAVVLLSKEGKAQFGETEKKLTATAANFLGKQLEQ